MNFIWGQSPIDFGNIFPLSPNIPLKVLALISVHATANTIMPALLVILLYHRKYGGGMETTGKIRHIEVTENILSYSSRVT